MAVYSSCMVKGALVDVMGAGVLMLLLCCCGVCYAACPYYKIVRCDSPFSNS